MALDASGVTSASLLRRRNQRLVLELVRARGAIRRSGLMAATGLAKSTIKEVCDSLIELGHLEEVRDTAGHRAPGRPAAQLRLAASLGVVLGLDVGADKVLAMVADLTGNALATVKRPVLEGARTRDGVLRQLRSCVGHALAVAGMERTAIAGTVIGTPGAVDPATGRISLAPQIAGWDGTVLSGTLTGEVGGQVAVEREADLSFLAERAHGVAVGLDDGVFVHLGIGIGSSVLINGQIYRGHDGASGEIGYLPLPYGGESPPPGSGLGPFEWAAGGQAFARLGRETALSANGTRLLKLAGNDPNAVNARLVCAAAAEGDPASLALVERLAERIAAGIAATVCVLNPRAVIIGGGLSRAGDTLVTPITRHLRTMVPAMPEVLVSALGDEAVALGAVQRAADITMDSLLAD
ncbi:ROK family protein [Actinomadura barringtoniae]|uniref:ROK family protein n=1 Tax=Actinomadura barringtoniae TaxID=1427535 RepID=A0A939P979_9ACTN|nr:ROK family protein [Actinomadura barringtoniae]MBO2445638.1 ROK family protein [Actinomadura barringtoniae]